MDYCSRCGFSFLETRSIDAHASVPSAWLAGTGPAGMSAAGAVQAPVGTGSLVGQVINGKYRVLSILGEGGFGVVYKVELLLFDTANIFALKLLHPALSQDKSFRRRFLREAGLAMALIHENTIQIREFGQTEDGQLFFTMDYCAGEPLKSLISREGFLNLNRAVHVTRQILSVMKLAHSRGTIHRDLKPENIFLERDSQGRDFVKVGDFGLAKSFGPSEDATGRRSARAGQAEDITRGAILGTPRYMSPEQAIGRDELDDRSDLYSIGVVLYEMLYGQVPAERASSESSGLELKTPAPQPGHVVPGPVWEVVRKALEVDRERRFQSADEFLAAINALPKYTPTYAEKEPPRVRGRGLRLAALAGFCLLICFAAALVLRARGAIEFRLPWEKDPLESRPVAFPALAGRTLEAAADSAVPSHAGPALAWQRGGERGERSAQASRAGIRAYLSYRKGDVLRYEVCRNGIPDREITYHITDEPSPGVFTVSVSPGDRTFTWIVDEKENAFFQEFQLPDPRTGALTELVRSLRLRLPPANAIVDRNFTDGDLRMKMEREDLLLPRNPRLRYEKFAGCLRVESREEGRIHFQYYQEGNGLVGIEVYESLEVAAASSRDRKPPLYARYLIEHVRAGEKGN